MKRDNRLFLDADGAVRRNGLWKNPKSRLTWSRRVSQMRSICELADGMLLS